MCHERASSFKFRGSNCERQRPLCRMEYALPPYVAPHRLRSAQRGLWVTGCDFCVPRLGVEKRAPHASPISRPPSKYIPPQLRAVVNIGPPWSWKDCFNASGSCCAVVKHARRRRDACLEGILIPCWTFDDRRHCRWWCSIGSCSQSRCRLG